MTFGIIILPSTQFAEWRFAKTIAHREINKIPADTLVVLNQILDDG